MFAGPAEGPRKILLVDGHADRGPEQFTAALCGAYQEGVRAGGGHVRRLNFAAPGAHFADPSRIENALGEIEWASRLTVIAPLIKDKLPVTLATLFELSWYCGVLPAGEGQVRTIITMDYPAFAHRALLQDVTGANGSNHGLSLPGSGPPLLIGSIQALSPGQRATWLDSLRGFGAQDCDGRNERKPLPKSAPLSGQDILGLTG